MPDAAFGYGDARGHPEARAALAAGFHLLLWLPPDGPSEAEIVARAAEREVGLMPLGPLWHDPIGKPPGLVIGYASLPRHLFPAGLAALADVLADLA